MKISTRVRYGMRLMLELALHDNQGPIFLKDIARKQDISEKYLSQIIIPLRTAGLVKSFRGAHGGYELQREPEAITLRQVMEALEGESLPGRVHRRRRGMRQGRATASPSRSGAASGRSWPRRWRRRPSRTWWPTSTPGSSSTPRTPSSTMGRKLYVVLMGLPAMGKSTIAFKLCRNLQQEGLESRIFNNGDLRRRMTALDTSSPEFYDPGNRHGVEIREKIALKNLHAAKAFLRHGGHVAIIDATNASPARRRMIQTTLDDHPILFIECLNDDRDLIATSIEQKATQNEFAGMPRPTPWPVSASGSTTTAASTFRSARRPTTWSSIRSTTASSASG